MRDRPVIAVIGAGAVGAYYGGRLAQHGHDVHFLVRSDYDAVVREGWRIKSHDGDFELPAASLHVYDAPAKMPKADLVIVTLKATANDQYEPLISPLLHEGTLILTLQNGLGNEDSLSELLGADRILGAIAFVCINRTGPGQITHTQHGLVRIGDYTEGRRDRAERLAAMFSQCKIRCDVLGSLRYGRWEKLVWNIPFNGLGAALDLTTDRLIDDARGRALVEGIMAEVIAAANAVGVALSGDLIERQMALTRSAGAYVTSMQIDRREGRPMEVEAILGKPFEAARGSGLATPKLEMLYDLVRLVNLGNQSRLK